MEAEHIFWPNKDNCSHKTRHYTRKRFDILNGIEITETKCIDCHKIIFLELNKIGR